MATIFGDNTNNVRVGTSSADTIVGRAGNDQLSGLGDNDRLNGGLGNDVLNGGVGVGDIADYSNGSISGQSYIGATAGVTVNLTLAGAQNTGGAGVDTLVGMEHVIGTAFNDVLTGNSVRNALWGLAGHDVLNGGLGDDVLNGGLGNDVLNGGAGNDTADYSAFVIPGLTATGTTGGVTVNLSLTGAQNTGGAGRDTLVGIEQVIGTDFNDNLTGNSGNNLLSGRGGNDTVNGGSGQDQLSGGLGNDLLNGGSGNDTLNGFSGNDVLNGGDGVDTASYLGETAGVTADLNKTGPQNTGGSGFDTLVSIEHVIGSNFGDTLTGADGDFVSGIFAGNILDGGLGNDILYAGEYNDNVLNGGAGNDTLYSGDYGSSVLNGGTGDDKLYGGDGGDTLNGGDGNDILSSGGYGGTAMNGGAGNDMLYCSEGGLNRVNGGTGADTLYANIAGGSDDIFDYNSVSDSPSGTGRDVIHNFNAEDDVGHDQIDLRDIDANTLVAGNQAFIWGGSFSAGHLRYVGGVLQGNTDGDTAAEFEIQLVGAPALTVGGAGTDILL
ncbi:MAG: calcium-binding protein [Nitrospira sp.]|nr:calcium-binding protein [Nitrospira sp.]